MDESMDRAALEVHLRDCEDALRRNLMDENMRLALEINCADLRDTLANIDHHLAAAEEVSESNEDDSEIDFGEDGLSHVDDMFSGLAIMDDLSFAGSDYSFYDIEDDGDFYYTDSMDDEESYMGDSEDDNEEEITPVNHAANVHCISCFQSFPPHEALSLSCQPTSHSYCRTCVKGVFEASLSNNIQIGPVCCGKAIPVEDARQFLPDQLYRTIEEKSAALSTPNPTYCSDPYCSKFIRSDTIVSNVASCPVCKRKTCVSCKKKSHDGDCAEDAGTQQLLEVARTNHWQRCNKCGNLVELNAGCHHITCPCSAQFCYVCGEKWKTCSCPLWEERYILQSPEEEPVAPEPCRYHQWRRYERNYGLDMHCEVCDVFMPRFILSCRNCHQRECVRCSRRRR